MPPAWFTRPLKDLPSEPASFPLLLLREALTAMLNDVQKGIGIWSTGSVSGTTGEMLLERTAQRLEDIKNELQLFVDQCGRESADNTVKAKKRRWIMQSDKLQKLREKTMDAKMNLHFALSSHSRGLVCEQ
ncbi:hypothetical protein ACHAPT_009569 [Fusarium lateritium]